MNRLRPLGRLGSAAVCVGALLALPAAPASAALSQPAVTSQTPSTRTPHAIDDDAVANAAVNAFAQVGGTMYAGGRFRSVQDPARTTTYSRAHLFSFDVATGVPTRWAPQLNGEVTALEADPGGRYLYVGGSFTHTFPSGRVKSLVRFDLATGALDSAWEPLIYKGAVLDLQVVSGRLIVAGRFGQRLASVSLTTGKVLGDLQIPFAGSVASNAGAVAVSRFAVDPTRTRLVAVGNFSSVGGLERYRAVMIDLGSTSTVAPWSYAPLKNMCKGTSLPDYLKDVDFSPDGSWFVIAGTGYVPATPEGVGRDVCDAAARFETGVSAPARPTWINYTGGDTLYSVAVTGAAVYVGGHQRWLDNPQGVDTAGPGAVARPGIGAIDPATGKALPWNPTKTRGVGNKVIYPTPAGVWFGSDGKYFGGRVHDALAFTPTP